MIDVAVIKVKAGNGGRGAVSFRREKFIPNGGPDGGDGGKGGSVYFVADHNMSTLLDFRSKPIFKAGSGEAGRGRKMTGLSKEDLYIRVPTGTLVYELGPSGEVLIGDLVEGGQKLLVAQGGIGGKGNFRFRSSTNQAPRQYTDGAKGETKGIRLEVKLLADIGVIGIPNSGKSTLLNRLTNANAKIGNYPFTTLEPNLGTWTIKGEKEIIMADIPGLIEGASKGKGLGYEFLRHIERTRILLHLIDCYGEQGLVVSALAKYKAIKEELAAYNVSLGKKPEIVVINKCDITEVKDAFPAIQKAFKEEGIEVLGISASTGEGLKALENKLILLLSSLPEKAVFATQKTVKQYTIDNLPNKNRVFKTREVKED